METKLAGWKHFAGADWAAARDAFLAALEVEPGDPEALDGLGQSLWWLGRRDEAIDLRRDAYAAYRERGDYRQAGLLAVYLAGEHRIDGQRAAAAGWLARARRLLAHEGAVPERGWLAIEDAKRSDDPVTAEEHARAALDLAQVVGDPNVECMALAQLGRALVGQGRVEEGLTLLDEAMTVALGGESRDPLAVGDACCTTLVVCDRLCDLDRAAQWCELVVDFTERRRYTPVQSWCRGVYGGVLVRAGEWDRAEEVLAEALRRNRVRRASDIALPLAVLAELRLRQGRVDEAATLLVDHEDDRAALAPLVQLHLQRGETTLAAAVLDRAFARANDDPDALVLRGAVAVAQCDLAAAESIAEQLRGLAEQLARDDLAAEAALLAGRASAARGDAAAAESDFEDAVALFASLRFPLEEARARLALARVQADTESPLARRSGQAALDVFERLGARRDADEAAALLRSLGTAGRTARRGERGQLTAREREVLVLLAAGLTNAEIAERLVIAPKTAEHHVGHVLAKLGVRSRAEAAAHAVREGL